MVETDLDDYRKVRGRLTRGRYVDDVSINDVILATVTGALRTWMQPRGLPVTSASTLRVIGICVHANRSAGGSRRPRAAVRGLAVNSVEPRNVTGPNI